MLKRILTLMLVVAMVLSVCAMAGCKSKNFELKGESGNVAGLAQSEEEYFLDMPAELKGTTVKFGTWIDHTQTNTSICLNGFQETTGMKFELFQVNEREYIVKLLGYITADQAPDVVLENGDFPRTLNVLQPLSLEANGLDPKDPFWNQQITEMYHIGECYYLVNGAHSSWDMGGHNTFFNKTILEENGIKTPAQYVKENNWNLNTMWTLMQQIQSQCGLDRPGTVLVFDPWLAMHGAYQFYWNEETDKFENGLKSENARKAIEYLLKAKDAGLASVCDNHDDSFASGATVMQLCGAYGLLKHPGFFSTMDVDDMGFTVLPKINASDADYPYTCAIRAYGICKGAKNPVGAAYFLRYFLNMDNYDLDQIYKTEECKDFYMQLLEKENFKNNHFSQGVLRVSDVSNRYLTITQELIDGTAAQMDANLNKLHGKMDGAANEANKLIAKVIEGQSAS
ncbi:MAG: extracellular solute-binding protein [Ruminococcaceae bacterium]|nr:extracellular solute-binding protein [Oscillospiraceae bacterium]